MWYLIQSSQDPLTVSGETERDRMHQVRMKRDSSVRQSTELGTMAIKSFFPQLKDFFVHEENKEREITMKWIYYFIIFNHIWLISIT